MKYTEYLSTVSDCPFCNSQNMQDQTIEENDTFRTAICLAPYHTHHVLVLPKRHIEKITDLNEKEIVDAMHLQKRAVGLMYALGYDNVSILLKEGSHSGKSVGHIHYHIVPDIHLTNLEHTMGDRELLSVEDIGKEVLEFKKILA